MLKRKIQEYNKAISAFCQDNSTSWRKYIYLAQKVLNDTENQASGLSSTEIVFGFKPETVLDRLLRLPDDDKVDKDRLILKAKIGNLMTKVQKARENYKKHFDKHRQNKLFKVDDLVAIVEDTKASLKHNVRFR